MRDAVGRPKTEWRLSPGARNAGRCAGVPVQRACASGHGRAPVVPRDARDGPIRVGAADNQRRWRDFGDTTVTDGDVRGGRRRCSGSEESERTHEREGEWETE